MSKKPAEESLREAYGRALANLGAKYPRLVVLDADLSTSTKTAEFARVYPKRFFNMGIAEQNLLGTAAGFALAGKIPVVSSFAVFATGRAFEQVRNSVAHAYLNVKIVATHAGITVGEDGASHQSIEDLALMRALPNMTVVVPADARETEKALEAIINYEGPVYMRLPRISGPVLFGAEYEFTLGKARCLREGKDAAILAAGLLVGKALKVAEELAGQGIEVAVWNYSTIKPLDRRAVITAAQETGAIVTAEEHTINGGLGSAVAEVLAEEYPVPLVRKGIPDRFGESGKPDELLELFGLDVPGLIKAVQKVLKKKERIT